MARLQDMTVATLGDRLLKAAAEEVRTIIAEESEKACAAANKEIERRVNALADRIALGVLRKYEFTQFADRIVIEVRKTEPEKGGG